MFIIWVKFVEIPKQKFESLIMQRSANTRFEKPRIREERAKIGPVALIKLACMLPQAVNLNYTRHFEEEC